MTQPTPLPFGIREIKIAKYTDLAATTLGASVKLPNSRKMSFAESEAFEELRGDDRVVASHGAGPMVEFEFESGGYPFEAVASMYGGTLTETGVAPNRVKTLRKLVTDVRPYFKTWGRAIADNGGDLWIVIYKCKCDGNLSGEMGDGAFYLTGASGKGYASTEVASLDRVWDFVQNETLTPLP